MLIDPRSTLVRWLRSTGARQVLVVVLVFLFFGACAAIAFYANWRVDHKF